MSILSWKVKFTALKGSVQLLMDLSAFDNQVTSWREREIKILLSTPSSPPQYDNLTVCSSLDDSPIQAGTHFDLNIAYVTLVMQVVNAANMIVI